MIDPHTLRLLNGQPFEPVASIPLQVGPLSLLYEEGSLRGIRLGRVELVRQIYSAVRDHNWGTVPGKLHNVTLHIEPDQFEIHFESIHQQNEIDFRWHGHIQGHPEGIIRFQMIGVAHSRFQRNRIGFCVLHPMSCAGNPCRLEQVDGTVVESQFPVSISPHQPFKMIRTLAHEYAPGQWVEVRMEGDTFEMEDQRNWIDASYKTYCTPLEVPFPVTVETGTRIEQTITLRLLNPPTVVNQMDDERLTVRFDDAPGIPLPLIGLATASHGEALSDSACERLRQLKLAHLRVDVRFGRADWADRFTADVRAAQCMDVPLEIALHLAQDAESELAMFVRLWKSLDVPVVRYLIFKQGEKSTRAAWLHLARRVLGDQVPLVGGTDAFFAELNRERPEYDAMDGVVYSINPQVHAFDDVSLGETLQAQATTVETARTFAGTKPIHVGPATFKMRWNPNATAPQPPPEPDELPSQADPRQMSLFGAGWTLNSIKYLALGGAASLTYYETTGYTGIMATESGSALPEWFWNIPGGVYPMYHIFADFGDFRGGEMIALHSTDPMRIDGCVLRRGDRLRYLLANMTRQPQVGSLTLPGGVRANLELRRLDSDTAEYAMREPEAYRAGSGEILTLAGGQLDLLLPPFAVFTLDQVSR